MAKRQFGAGFGVGAQIMLVVAGLAVAVMAPPAHGTMLAVPLTGTSAVETVNLALGHGATIEGIGPVAGSIILRGDRWRLAAALQARGVLLLAAPSGLCGA